MAVIIDCARTPFGKLMGSLARVSAPELAAHCIGALLKRADVAPSQVSEIILGNALQAGVGPNPARQAALLAHVPTDVPAFTVNKLCGSGLKAVFLAAQAIDAGQAKLILAGGAESMSNAPHVLHVRKEVRKGDISLANVTGRTRAQDTMLHDALYDGLYQESLGSLMEHVIKKYKVSREEQDVFAFRSHKRALAASWKDLVPLKLGAGAATADECPRSDASLQQLSILPSAFEGCSTITAGNACPNADGASMVLVAHEKTAENLALKPMARITGMATAAVDPKLFGVAPARAFQLLEQKTGISAPSYDMIELQESFAAQTLALAKEAKLDVERINPHGGALALGHPLAASGPRMLASLVQSLKEQRKKTGLLGLCVGGGLGMAMSVELL